jgi:hypothetical protein
MAPQKSKMSLKKKIGIALLVILAIPVTYSVVVIVQQKSATRAAVEQKTDKKVADFEAALIDSGIAGSQIASSKVSVCYVDHQDEGWFAANWYQGCFLRYVRGYTTGLTKPAIESKVSASSGLSSLSGTIFGDNDPCEISFGVGDFNFTYLPAGVQRSEYSSCEIPDQLQGISSIDPVVLDDELTVKSYKVFDAAQVSSTQDQIWFDFDQNYYRENLGCAISLLCDSPRDRAVQE